MIMFLQETSTGKINRQSTVLVVVVGVVVVVVVVVVVSDLINQSEE